jgi:hypothetical protein
VIVAGFCSLGVGAFALDGSGDTGTVADPAVTTVAPTTTVAPAPDGSTTDPGATDPAAGPPDVSTVDCPAGQTYANHGAYVSSVAHDPGRMPGDVQAAAQSDCGKPLTAGQPVATTAPTDAAVPSAPASPPVAPGNSGNAPGHNK